MKSNLIKVVCIGGGSGLSQFVKGIKDIEHIDLKCIVTVADNGGSTGRLKEELNIPAVGDIRNVLLALSNVEDDMASIFSYRFKEGSLAGHSLGNLIIAGAIQASNNDFTSILDKFSNVFNMSGKIIPSSCDVVDIKAVFDDGSEVFGEKDIDKQNKRIDKIAYINEVKASKEAVRSIEEADLIIYSIGSLYTSLIPNLIIPEINEAIKNAKAKKFYFLNLMSQPGETNNYSMSMYVNAINKHLGFNGIDVIIVNNKEFDSDVLKRYRLQNSYPVVIDKDKIDDSIKLVFCDIASVKNNKIMHSPKKINAMFKEEIECHLLRMLK